MMITHNNASSFLLTALCLLLPCLMACNDNEKEAEAGNKDRQVVLENIGANIIIPNYNALDEKVQALETASQNFSDKVSLENLKALQEANTEAYLAWQRCAVFELGPAESVALRANINTFPADIQKIESNISAGEYDLKSFTSVDAKGFPALDYLLFNGDDNIVLEQFVGEGNKRIIYLQDVVSDMLGLVNTVSGQWNTDYLATFISRDGLDIGSSLGLLVNQFVFDYERVKNERVGIPLGKKSLGDPLPKYVEAYYSGKSIALAVQNLKALQNIYLGISPGGIDGAGIHDYLIGLKAQHNGGLLADTLKAKLAEVIAATAAMPAPLSNAVVHNPAAVEEAYIALQMGVVLFKVDMTSDLGVSITYQDNDGD